MIGPQLYETLSAVGMRALIGDLTSRYLVAVTPEMVARARWHERQAEADKAFQTFQTHLDVEALAEKAWWAAIEKKLSLRTIHDREHSLLGLRAKGRRLWTAYRRAEAEASAAYDTLRQAGR